VTVAPVIVLGSIGSLKVALTVVFCATPALPFAGKMELTVGLVVSAAYVAV
jgi:hypothetical protein